MTFSRFPTFLYEQSAAKAVGLVRQIYSAALGLKDFPKRGRPGRKEGTRELVVPGLPYIIVYEVYRRAVRILRVLHGAPRWPS